MKAGFFEKDITPPVGVYLAGFGYRDKPSEGITDPLFLRIMAIEDDKGKRVVFVTADILTFPKDMSWRIKYWCELKLGLESSSVLLNSSHTHCGPVLSQEYSYPHWPVDIAYVEELEKNIKEGIKTALNGLNFASFKYGLAQAHFAVNRRLPSVDGQKTLWGANENGYYDPDLPIITVGDKGGNIRGIIYSYACHPTSKGGYNISADYPGAVSRALKKTYDQDVFTMFLQGAAGSTKPRFFDKETKNFVQATVQDVEKLGAETAEIISSFIRSDKMRALELTLAGCEKEFDIPVDINGLPDKSELLAMSEADSNNAGCYPLTHRIWARHMLEDLRVGKLNDRYQLCAVEIRLTKDILIIGLSGEVTAELGRFVKNIFQDKEIIFLGYCSYTDAYLPADEMLPEGGYEVIASGIEAMRAGPFASGINKLVKNEIRNIKLNSC